MKINLNYLRQLHIENFSLINTFPLALLLIGVADFLLFNFSLDLVKKVYNFFAKSQVEVSTNSCKHIKENMNQDSGLSGKEQPRISIEDIEIVLKSLCISFLHEEGGKLNCDDLLNIFEEETTTFNEIKEAFDVFDENKDGFIDAEDLQRVLLALGFNEGSKLEDCKKMIKAFDENNDDRIDFNEFLRFMENNDC